MKKILSVILVISLLASLLAVSASAAGEYPESEHDYANNTVKSWTYEYPEDAEGLEIVFSDKCLFEFQELFVVPSAVYPSTLTDEMLNEIKSKGYCIKEDYVEITDEYGYDECFTGRNLAGRVINITGNKFTITLHSDLSETYYGFKIESISKLAAPVVKADATVNFIIDGETVVSNLCKADKEVRLPAKYRHRQYGDKAIIGWKTDDGKEFFYTERKEDYGYYYGSGLIAQEGKEYNLSPVYCKIGLKADEVFSFTNSDYKTFMHDFGGYVYTKNDFKRQFIDWITTFGLSPMLPLALAVLTFITAYWPEGNFDGSCCGFAVTALLQHYGKIDILSQQGVEKVSDLEPTDEMQSTINFYNNAAMAAHLVNHWGLYPATKEYTYQLKNLYETLEAGTPVYFEYYPSADKPPMRAVFDFFKNPFKNSLDSIAGGAHGIVLTGAYTDADGNHVLIGWNNNSTEYPSGCADVYVINKDFTQINDGWDDLCGFAWNDDLSTFESFPTEGIVNPFSWHINFIKHIFEFISHLFINGTK